MPSTPLCDVSHPLARDLKFWYTDHTGVPVNVWPLPRLRVGTTGDFGHSYVPENSSSDITPAAHPIFGHAFRFSGDATNDRIPLGQHGQTSPLTLASFAGGFTVDAWFTYRSDSAVARRIFDKSDGANVRRGWAIYYDNTTLTWQADNTSGVGTKWNYNVTFVDGQTYHLCYVMRDIDAAGGCDLYIDGVEVTPTLASSSASVVPNNATNAAIGNWNTSTDRMWSGEVHHLRVWHRELLRDEVIALHRDPLAMLRRRNRRAFAVPVGGGVFDETITLAADSAAQAPSGLITASAAIALAVDSASVSVAADVTLDEIVALTGDATLAPSGVIDTAAALVALSATGTLSPAGALVADVLAALAADAGTSQSGGLAFDESIALAADSATFALSEIITKEESIALGADASVAPSVNAALAAALALDIQADIANAAQLVSDAQIALAASGAALTPASVATLEAALTLSVSDALSTFAESLAGQGGEVLELTALELRQPRMQNARIQP